MEIRIEGKDLQAASAPANASVDDSQVEKKALANIDVRDIERIVFEASQGGAYQNGPKPGSKMAEYVEEESYVNPVNIDSQSELDYED